eukprot:CFRG0360T1
MSERCEADAIKTPRLEDTHDQRDLLQPPKLTRLTERSKHGSVKSDDNTHPHAYMHIATSTPLRTPSRAHKHDGRLRRTKAEISPPKENRSDGSNRVQRLDAKTISLMRTSISITSVAQCVEELVLNSIDAHASSIEVRVNLSNFSVIVSDNGIGIDVDSLQLVGERYTTSKCGDGNFSALTRPLYFGLFGEALASLRDISTLEIHTRCGDEASHLKKFKDRALVYCGDECPHRSESGTTVHVQHLFYNLPIRQRMQDSGALNSIKRSVQRICIVHPKIKFRITNDVNDSIILDAKPCESMLESFRKAFPMLSPTILDEMKPINVVNAGKYELTGFISTVGNSTKNFQFIYLNRRLLLKTTFHKQMNEIFKTSSLSGLQKTITSNPQNSPPIAKSEKYAVFVLNLTTTDEYDICIQHDKSLVEFKNWNGVLTFTNEALTHFLRKHDLMLETSTTKTGFSNILSAEKTEISDQNSKIFEYHGSYLRSLPVKRKPVEKDIHANTRYPDYKNSSSCNPKATYPSKGDDAQSITLLKDVPRSQFGSPLTSTSMAAATRSLRTPGRRNGFLEGIERSPLSSVTLSNRVKTRLASMAFSPKSRLGCTLVAEIAVKEKQVLNARALHFNEEDACSDGATVPLTTTQVDTPNAHRLESQTAQQQDSGSVHSTFKRLKALHTCASKLNMPGGKGSTLASSTYSKVVRDMPSCPITVARNTSGISSQHQQYSNSEEMGTNRVGVSKSVEPNRRTPSVMSKSYISTNQPILQPNVSTSTSTYTKAASHTDVHPNMKTSEDEQPYRENASESIVYGPGSPISRQENHNKPVAAPSTTDICSPTPSDTLLLDHSSQYDRSPILPRRENHTTVAGWKHTEVPPLSNKRSVNESAHSTPKAKVTSSTLLIQGKNVNVQINARPIARTLLDEPGHAGHENRNSHFSLRDEHKIIGVGECIWEERVDPLQGRTYYLNTMTGNTSFSKPSVMKKVEARGSQTKRIDSRRPSSSSIARPHRSLYTISAQRTPTNTPSHTPTCRSTSRPASVHNTTGTPTLFTPTSTSMRLTEDVLPIHCLSGPGEPLQSTNCIRSAEGEQVPSLCSEHYVSNHVSEGNVVVPTNRVPEHQNTSKVVVDVGKSVGDIHDLWENPVFEPTLQSSVRNNVYTKFFKSSASVNNQVPVQFTKQMLQHARVLSQVDNRFIACLFFHDHNSSNYDMNESVIVLVDQHAAHERIRLENILNEFDGGRDNPIAVVQLDPFVGVKTTVEEAELVEEYKDVLLKWGIECIINLDSTNEERVIVCSLPNACHAGIHDDEQEQVVRTLLREQIDLHKQTGNMASVIPRVMRRVFNNTACRGAIMFGDPLTSVQCRRIMDDLSKCNLPFQCAHGRPTMIPLADTRNG